MRQTQILRSLRRPRAAEPAPVAIPTAPVADTRAAGALLETIEALLGD